MKRRHLLKVGAGTLAASLPNLGRAAVSRPTRVLCWSEGTAPTSVYPKDIADAVAEALRPSGEFELRTASLADAEQGISESVLSATDVLFWWGHQRHGQVRDDRAEAIVKRVRDGGMGFVALHSSQYSKPFKRLMGDTCDLGGAGINDAPELVSVKAPGHPIARGVPDFQIPREEFYNEPFQVPRPDLVLFESRWRTGQRFRSGCLWKRGSGQVFYFRAGHETFPTYFLPEVKGILVNAARWIGPRVVSIQIVPPD